MASFSRPSDNEGEPSPKAVPKVGAAGSGGGRKAKTRNGSMDMGGGGGPSWQASGRLDDDGSRKVLHSHLKDMAIDALEIARIKEQQPIAEMINLALGSDIQPEMAEVLASMVLAAYSCALETRDERALYLAYSCFTDAQLKRILLLACGK